MTTYTVKTGEVITDVVINATGNINNWELILQANNFDTWTPKLLPDQQIIIPDSCVLASNIISELRKYPICNKKPVDWETQLNNIINRGQNNYVLMEDGVSHVLMENGVDKILMEN